MKDRGSDDACRDGNDCTPPPIRENAKGKYHQASQYSDFDPSHGPLLACEASDRGITGSASVRIQVDAGALKSFPHPHQKWREGRAHDGLRGDRRNSVRCSGDRLKSSNEAGSKVVVWDIALLCHVSSSVDQLSPTSGTRTLPGARRLRATARISYQGALRKASGRRCMTPCSWAGSPGAGSVQQGVASQLEICGP
jgi:hypothetical protein